MANVQVMLDQAIRLQQQGRLAEAQRICDEVLTVDPKNADAMNLLGIVHQLAGNQKQALALFGDAIAIQPHAGVFHYNRGNSLLHLRRYDDAAEAFASAIRLEPELFEAQMNLANALMLSGRTTDAATAFEKALAREPFSPEAHNNLGLALKYQGRVDDAIAQFREAIELKTDYQHAHSNLLYALHFSARYTAQDIFAAHRAWATQFAEPLEPAEKRWDNDRSPDRRLRVGYISPDFREHPAGRFMLPIFAHHDREQFEIIAYSDTAAADDVMQRLRAGASAWREIARLPDAALAQLVRKDAVDILVDLSLHMNRNRLLMFARQPAPVQATFVAYPATSGMTQIGYRITDPHLDPPGETEAVNSEQLMHLTHSYWCYGADGDEPEVNDLPAKSRGYITFGSVNNPSKVSGSALDLWSKVLAAIPGSRLLFMLNEREPRGERWAGEFLSRGVDPERITFVTKRPRLDYLRLFHDIDIGLDPFPYNGHTTTCDAMWMGVPIISLRGETSVGRGGVSLLSNVGLTDLLATTRNEYLQIATQLANDLPRLSELRAMLRQRMNDSPLRDERGFVRDIERLYRAMWQQFCRQGNPAIV